ncbi:hypothetical protein G5714_002399 [Onychostoma macrolepis]|uniref:Uncharacterized protein n=1 Tax=Onychostoma macrolepis TaxID=369639 RepID=A0A7J6DEV3_9TELE|nr:hypothetical protein G5714_002399 [Onychostoma macrolepis]
MGEDADEESTSREEHRRTLGNGLTTVAASSDTGQQVNHPRVQDLVTVLACQEIILGNGLNTDVIYGSLLSAMEMKSLLENRLLD